MSVELPDLPEKIPETLEVDLPAEPQEPKKGGAPNAPEPTKKKLSVFLKFVFRLCLGCLQSSRFFFYGTRQNIFFKKIILKVLT
ncbi:hypothetical protein [Treponema zioleckii]|uniref:hypothetical protein n=1 Tax=Treponema zioleckii TaxID=331680 RepID=UPI00168ACBA8|nr:hypothetical protein [Treponema zioleckii]